MKKLFSVWLLVLLAICALAQSPSFTVKSADSTKVRMNQMKIDVKIVGNIAYTNVEMHFFNGASRQMEGELIFPLPEGISVSHYAIDINGKMREAVPVNKSKGKQVFEAIENRRVDPGLLEKVDGNNFRTRVYPLPVNGERIVQIGYEEELKFKDNSNLMYQFLSRFPYKLDNFTVNIEVLGANQKPQIESTKDVAFAQWSQSYKTSINKKDYLPNEKFEILVPVRENIPSVYAQSFDGNNYFYAQLFLDDKALTKKAPKTIGLVYDVSLSCRNRDFEKESALLKNYLTSLNNVTVSVFFLNYTFKKQQDFIVQNGNSDALINFLKNAVYDGGTRYSEINLPANLDEYLFFTDGLSSLSAKEIKLPQKPIYTITSSVSADYSYLNFVSMNSSANFINLNSTTTDEALHKLTSQNLRFLGVKNNIFVTELYPAVGTPVGKSFSVAGISVRPQNEITLLFGYGNEATIEKKISLDVDAQTNADVNVYKLWVQKKIAYLDMDYAKNQTEIEILGTKAGIATRNTSLIVLETIQDYIRYEVVPPAELRPEYDRITKEQQQNAAARQQSNMANLDTYFKSLNDWWKQDIKYDKPVVVNPPVNPEPPTPHPPRPPRRPQPAVKSVAPTMNAEVSERAMMMADEDLRSIELSSPVFEEVNIGLGQTVSVRDLTTAVTGVSGKDLARKPVNNVSEALAGSMAGVSVSSNDGSPDAQIRVRGGSSVTQSGEPLYIVDGLPVNSISNIPANEIENVSVVKDASATAIYGARAANGVVIVTTKEGAKKGDKPTPKPVAKTTNPYTAVDIIRSQPKEKQYEAYLQIREDVVGSPTFYIEAARVFKEQGDNEKALLVLSSIADLGFENHQLYKTLTYIFREWGAPADALYTAQQVAKWRDFEPQSFRDLALTLEDNGKYQDAFDTLVKSLETNYLGEMSNFYTGIEDVILMDINRLITEHSTIDTKKLDKKYLDKMPVDVRVIMNWNLMNTDIDMHVIDPTGEECYYSHKTTRAGGRFGKDFTRGYGPEQYLLRNKLTGKYKISSNFYGENAFTENGPASVFIEVYYKDKNGKMKRELKTILSGKDRDRKAIMLELDL